MLPLLLAAGGLQAGLGFLKSRQDKSNNRAFNKAVNGATKFDIGKDISSYIKGYGKGMPKVLGLENKFRPKFQDLNLKEAGGFLSKPGGYFDIQKNAQDQQGNMLQQGRATDLAGLTALSGQTRSYLDSLSPEGAAQVRAANEQAAAAQAASHGLSAQEERSAQQFAREGSASRGRLMDNSSMASELLNRDSYLTQKRQEASVMTNNAANLAQSFYTDPGMRQLNTTPQSYQAGISAAGVGLGSIGSATPQMINPDVGVNIAAANRKNKLDALLTKGQANASNSSGMANGIASILSTYMQSKGGG
jgi:hypothetical protein